MEAGRSNVPHCPSGHHDPIQPSQAGCGVPVECELDRGSVLGGGRDPFLTEPTQAGRTNQDRVPVGLIRTQVLCGALGSGPPSPVGPDQL